jgi:putative two-component system response regulator
VSPSTATVPQRALMRMIATPDSGLLAWSIPPLPASFLPRSLQVSSPGCRFLARVSSRILIADNNGAASGVLAGWLTAAGHECTTTATGEALSDARRLSPDVVIVSVRGSDDGGLWVMRALRAQREQTAVIVVASPPDFDVAVTANRLGVVDCLPGPPTKGAVIEAVTRAGLWRDAVAAAQSDVDRYPDEIAVQRSQLHETLSRVDPDAAQSVLLAILEARTPDTHDHAQRVAKTAVMIGRCMGLPGSQIEELQRAALLHDIGKIAIPARLLADTASLSEADIAMLRQHVTIGAEILGAVPVLAFAAPIVLATHERLDGRGYPAALAGDAIPLEARIISVADVYDALTGVRPYREPVSHDQANAELVRAAGQHLDPTVVRAWLGLSEDVRCS